MKASVWVVIQSGNKILALKRGPKANNPNLWNLPGGGIEKSEKPEKTAIREVWEECGLRVKNLQLFCVLPLNGKLCYYFKVKIKIPPVVLNPNDEKDQKKLAKYKVGQFVNINKESSEYRWLDIAELANLPLHLPTKKLFNVVDNKLIVKANVNLNADNLKNDVAIIASDTMVYRKYSIVDRSGKVLASALYWLTNKLSDLEVDYNFRNMGLGKTLVAYCQDNHDRIILYAKAPEKQNQAKLLKFYKSLGFTITGKQLLNGSVPMEWKNANTQ